MLRLTSRHRNETVSGYKSIDNGGGVVTRQMKIHATGAALFFFVIVSACLSMVGISLASGSHAPFWAVLLFLSILAITVPLGGVVGYLFYLPREQGTDTSSRVS